MQPQPHEDPLVQAKVMTMNSGRHGAIARARTYIAAKPETSSFWTQVIYHLENTSFD